MKIKINQSLDKVFEIILFHNCLIGMKIVQRFKKNLISFYHHFTKYNFIVLSKVFITFIKFYNIKQGVHYF